MADMDLKTMSNIRDLFGLSHDLIGQAKHSGHLSAKIAEALAFLKFQYDDFDRRVKDAEKTFTEKLKDQIAAEALAPAPSPAVTEVNGSNQ